MPTLTYCVLVQRSDGVNLGFTSFNQDLTIRGVVYKASSAVDPTAVSSKTDLSADNLDLTCLIDNEDIKPQELIAGLYDEARVTIALVDFVNLPTTINNAIVLLKGRIGQVRITDTSFTFEVRSIAELTNRPLNNRVTPTCNYTFGGSKCGKDLVAAGLFLTDLEVISTSDLLVSFDTTQLTGDFIEGILTFNSGANKAMSFEITDVSNPSLTIEGELAGAIAVGDTVTIKAHCNKTQQACKAYDNFSNFGGFPVGGNWLPGLDRITVVK